MAPMRPSSRESEVKLRFPSAADALAALDRIGAVPVRAREFEDNLLYDLPGKPLGSSGRLLRLRRAGGRATLTYKAPVSGPTRHKVREEHESRVEDADALARILEGLGYAPVWRYQKYRSTFAVDDVEVTVDETPIGCWVEVEGPPERIDVVAASLGCGPDRFVTGTYFDLHREESGDEAGDLVFPGGEGGPGA